MPKGILRRTFIGNSAVLRWSDARTCAARTENAGTGVCVTSAIWRNWKKKYEHVKKNAMLKKRKLTGNLLPPTLELN